MKARNAGSTWPGPEYRILVSFRAPIDFVFAWCTDYTPEDAALEPMHVTPQSSQRARGAEVWAVLAALGRDGVAGLVDRTCALARRFADGMRGRLRPVQSPRRHNPTGPPMETEAPRVGCEAHEGGARSLLDAGMEEICLGPGGRLQALSSRTRKSEDVGRPTRSGPNPSAPRYLP